MGDTEDATSSGDTHLIHNCVRVPEFQSTKSTSPRTGNRLAHRQERSKMQSETKKALVYSIIVFVICYTVVQPLLDFITPKFLEIIRDFSSTFSNQIYVQAARMDKNNFGARLYSSYLGMISALISFPFFLPTLFSIFKKVEVQNKPKQILAPTLRATTPIFVLSFLIIFTSAIYDYSSYYLNLRFDRRITILAPYLSDQRKEELLSEWALMASRSDYEKIGGALCKYALENNLKKPESLWK